MVQYTRDPREGHSIVMPVVPLPEDLREQPNAQLLWRYHRVSGTSGPRSFLRLDDIVVGSSPGGYAQWAAQAFAPGDLGDPEAAGPAQDPEGWGVSNLARYALGAPATGDPRPFLPTGFVEDGRLGMRFRGDPLLADVAYRVRGTHDLTLWPWPEVLYDSRESPSPQREGELKVFRDPASTPSSPRFIKLEILSLDE